MQSIIVGVEREAENKKWDIICLNDVRMKEEELLGLELPNIFNNQRSLNGETSVVGFSI